MFPVEQLNRDILTIADSALPETEKVAAIDALVRERRQETFTTGASVHFYTGAVDKAAADPMTMLNDIRVAVTHRLEKNKPDGIGGSAGGLAKRVGSTLLSDTRLAGGTPIYPEEMEIIRAWNTKLVTHELFNAKASAHPWPTLQRALVAVFDDVVISPDGDLTLTTDGQTILDKNIKRELREELGQQAFAIVEPSFAAGGIKTGLTGIIDDGYIKHPAAWRRDFEQQGKVAYPCTANTVYTYIPAAVFAPLIKAAENAAGDGEIAGLRAINLPELLTRVSAVDHRDSNFDQRENYRYAHEGLVPWKIASELLGKDPDRMASLVRQTAPHFPANNRLDFKRIAAQLSMTLTDLDRQFGYADGTFADLQVAAAVPVPRAVSSPSPVF